MQELTPKQIVSELNKYVVGQDKAKKAVAIALRNRWRRQKVAGDLKEEIMPNNIIMIGPTGVGKTEIARRLAKLSQAPFIKVEASKYTEVGYVGRDVESMVRELIDLAVNMVKSEKTEEVQDKAREIAEDRILDLLLPPVPSVPTSTQQTSEEIENITNDKRNRTREKLRKQLREGKLDDRTVELEVTHKSLPIIEIFSSSGPVMEEMDVNIPEMFSGMIPKKVKRKKVPIPEAMRILIHEEAQKLIDMDAVVSEAVRRVENSGIIFIDEIDKIAGEKAIGGPDVSREGVQRDLLPIVEGSTVATKYGVIKTNHILFIAAGAFHVSKPSDLIPELQGRFPIRVELNSLTKEDFVRILTEPENALIKQYKALLESEGVSIEFTKDAIDEIAEAATIVNEHTENIGARRLHTIMTTLLEDILFNVPDTDEKKFVIDKNIVKQKLGNIIKDVDLSRYIL